MRRLIHLFAAVPVVATAQAVDYHKADLIRTSGAFVLNGSVTPVWFQDSTRFYYRSTSPRGEITVYLVDPGKRSKTPLFDNVRMARTMSLAGDTIFDPQKIPQTFHLTDDERALRWTIGKRRFDCALTTYACTVTDTAKVMDPDTPSWAVRSPDRKWEAFSHNHNIYIRKSGLIEHKRVPPDTGAAGRGAGVGARGGAGKDSMPPDSLTLPDSSIQLTTDGVDEWAYGTATPSTIQERPTRQRPQLIWSPDSKKIAVIRIDERKVRRYPLYSSTRNQPRVVLYPYAAPGDTVLVRYDTHVLDIETKTNVRVDSIKPPTIVHGMSGLAALKWSKQSDKLYVLDALRGAKRVTMYVADVRTGRIAPITRDSMATYVELVHGGGSGNWEVASNGDDVFFPSEKDGWLHIYRYDATGKLKNQVESGPYAVERIWHVADSAKKLYFTAWGREPGVPYYAHLYRIGFDGSAPTLLTPEDGNHRITFVPTGGYFLDTYSRPDSPPVTLLRLAADGSVVMTLDKADVDLLKDIGWTPAEVFTVKARDNLTPLWGLMYKPSNFDPKKKYPIITHIYPGPQVGSVGDWGFSFGSAAQARALAELGFIVIQLDHMGTPKRSKAFHDFYYGNMGDNGIPDHIAAIRQLAARYDWIDINKVGIFGFSGGGFASTDAILRYPDFFKVAVSGSGNHDNRTYGFFWGEKYQGLYKKDGASDNFESAANYTLARNLKGKLLLTTGDMDNNVHPSNTLRVVDALIRANKDFDLMVFPDVAHALPPYGVRKLWDYFVRNLMGAEPPAGYDMIGGPMLPTPPTAAGGEPPDPWP